MNSLILYSFKKRPAAPRAEETAKKWRQIGRLPYMPTTNQRRSDQILSGPVDDRGGGGGLRKKSTSATICKENHSGCQ